MWWCINVSVTLVGVQKVSTEEGQALADEYGIKFFETSAKSDINVDEVTHWGCL